MFLIVESQLFPCIDYIKKLAEIKYIKIEACEHFQKMSFRNRYVIAGANGLTSLTIPLAGGREQKKLITEIEIDHSTDWATKHWRSITSSYSKAPFFDYYEAEVKKLLFSTEKSLFNFNYFILTRISNWLNINLIIELTVEYTREIDVVDFRNQMLPKNFQVDGERWQPKYSQVFEDRLGFQPNLSILDLLFCEGPNARNLLEKSLH